LLFDRRDLTSSRVIAVSEPKQLEWVVDASTILPMTAISRDDGDDGDLQ